MQSLDNNNDSPYLIRFSCIPFDMRRDDQECIACLTHSEHMMLLIETNQQ